MSDQPLTCTSLKDDFGIQEGNKSYGGLVYDPITISIIVNAQFDTTETTTPGSSGCTTTGRSNLLYRFYLLDTNTNGFHGYIADYSNMCELSGINDAYLGPLQFRPSSSSSSSHSPYAGSIITSNFEGHEILMIEIDNEKRNCNTSPYRLPTILNEYTKYPWSLTIDPHTNSMLVDMYEEERIVIYSMDSYDVEFCAGSSAAICSNYEHEYCAEIGGVLGQGGGEGDDLCQLDYQPICFPRVLPTEAPTPSPTKKPTESPTKSASP